MEEKYHTVTLVKNKCVYDINDKKLSKKKKGFKGDSNSRPLLFWQKKLGIFMPLGLTVTYEKLYSRGRTFSDRKWSCFDI
jgi:hypothetical protein